MEIIMQGTHAALLVWADAHLDAGLDGLALALQGMATPSPNRCRYEFASASRTASHIRFVSCDHGDIYSYCHTRFGVRWKSWSRTSYDNRVKWRSYGRISRGRAQSYSTNGRRR